MKKSPNGIKIEDKIKVKTVSAGMGKHINKISEIITYDTINVIF